MNWILKTALGLALALCCLSRVMVFVNGDDNERRLIQDLLRDYDKRIRPTYNYTQSLKVTFGLALAQLIDVDEKNQIVTTNCWLNQAWLDKDLVWNASNYAGLSTVVLPYNDIWLPDIILYNSADVVSAKTSSVSTNVIVADTGNVTWLSTVIFKSSCTIDVRFFPFDEQNCSMVFASWTYDGSQLNLSLVEQAGDLSNYLSNSEFELIDMLAERNVKYYSCCVHPYPDITYYIHIRRRPMFYVFNLLLPCFLITLVALLGFYIPSESGEKVTMGITTLLSMTVFLMLVTEAMPPTSDSLPLIGIYYFVTIGLVSIATGMTVFTLNIHHKGVQGKTVPGWIKIVCFKILAPMLCVRLTLPTKSNSSSAKTSQKRRRTNNVNEVKMSDEHPIHNGVITPQMSPIFRSRNNIGSAATPSFRDIRSLMNSERVPLLPQANHMKSNGVHRVEVTHSPSTRRSTNIWPYPPQTPEVQMQTSLNSPISSRSGKQSSRRYRDEKLCRVLEQLTDMIGRGDRRLQETERKDLVKREWQQVAIVVDRLLLLLFILLTVGITVGLLMRGYGVRSVKPAVGEDSIT